MANTQTVTIPDIGGAVDVDVIEVLVKVGDTINQDDPMLTLESDKASMEIPSPVAGTIEKVHVAVGDKVSEGSVVLTVAASGATDATETAKTDTQPTTTSAQQPATETTTTQTRKATRDVCIPDIGGATNVDVIEVNVAVGDVIKQDDTLITLESDKASMEVPSPFAGTVTALKINVGDKVSEGDLILQLQAQDDSVAPAKAPAAAPQQQSSPPAQAAALAPKPAPTPEPETSSSGKNNTVYAGPAVRQLARELGVNLLEVVGTGRRGRITKDNLTKHVKQALSGQQQGGGLGFNLPPLTPTDFSKFGEVKVEPLNRIKKLSGSFLHRNWLTVPHVTQFADADITDLEAFRKLYKAKAEAQGFKLTPIVFVMKAVVAALKAFPQFNASLDPNGEQLILKQYYHIGVAVDTPNGLVVPVIRDVDRKGIFELAAEIGEISKQAREKGLTPAQMQGGCFSISSLGGIGGTAFTPIVNLPEVAILGLSKSAMKPVYQRGEFIARLTLPLSLSYDHRVIDGADAARFITYLADGLADLRLALL